MTKRIRYKIGDIFLVPLEDDRKGVGRVLINSQATVFIELYRIKPINDASEFHYEEAIKEPPIVRHWCYDDALRTGEWEIIDNRPIVGEIDMPYFWHQDAGDKRYYIRKGKRDSYRTSEERIEILKEETHKYEITGIGSEKFERNRYIKKLREAGLI